MSNSCIVLVFSVIIVRVLLFVQALLFRSTVVGSMWFVSVTKDAVASGLLICTEALGARRGTSYTGRRQFRSALYFVV